MRTRIVVALVIAQVLLVKLGTAEAQASRFDGRWQNEDGGSPLRWVDIRIIDNGSPSFLALWSCGRQDGCMFNGRVNIGAEAPIEFSYSEPQGKSLLRIREGDGGTLLIREETSWADGRGNKTLHRMHRISATAVAAPLPDVVVGRGRIGVRTSDGKVREVRQADPGNQPPRAAECKRRNPNEECAAVKLDVQMLRPPYNPADPAGDWIRQYNALLGQILSSVLRPRPDLLDAYARSESSNDYDQFVRRSEFLDYLTRPQP